MQQTVESVQSPEGVPPFEMQSDFDEQMPFKPQSPVHGCLVGACFLRLYEFKGMIGGKKKTKNSSRMM